MASVDSVGLHPTQRVMQAGLCCPQSSHVSYPHIDGNANWKTNDNKGESSGVRFIRSLRPIRKWLSGSWAPWLMARINHYRGEGPPIQPRVVSPFNLLDLLSIQQNNPQSLPHWTHWVVGSTCNRLGQPSATEPESWSQCLLRESSLQCRFQNLVYRARGLMFSSTKKINRQLAPFLRSSFF